MRHVFALMIVLLAAPAWSQSGPSFDCTKAESSAEELICAEPDLAALDRDLAGFYRQALRSAQQDASSQAADLLRATQRGWIKGRDDCWKAEDLRRCVEDNYQLREAELVTQWMLMDPTSVATWACEGNPANEVVTFFFDTSVPSVRFERGDSISTGVLVPTASGARYEANFGQSIWIKGEDATYRDPDPEGADLTCTLASSG